MSVKLQTYVTVTIPVELEFEGAPSLVEIRDSAIENFIAHPALIRVEDIEHYVKDITVESVKENT